MNRTLRLSLIAAGLSLSACARPVPIAFEGQNKQKLLRCTLRPNEQYLYPSNYLGILNTVRAGTQAEVTMYSTRQVDLSLNKVAYKLVPVTEPLSTNPDEFMKKFFVESPAELGLDKLDPSLKKKIETGNFQIGMTKDQAYAAAGPPQWVDFGVDATNLTLEQIMDKNRWEYRYSDIMASWWPVKTVFMFDEGKLTQVIQ
jgi:hypothetical protein